MVPLLVLAVAVNLTASYRLIRSMEPLLRDAVQTCRGCTLYKHATQAVFATVIVKACELRDYASLGGWLYSTATTDNKGNLFDTSCPSLCSPFPFDCRFPPA